MFESEAKRRSENYFKERCYKRNIWADVHDLENMWQDGVEFGYNKANEWFDAKQSIPLPKKAEIYRYTLEVIFDKGDLVCYDYKDKCWKKLVIENEKVTYVPVEIKLWCNKPTKESE